MRLGDWGEPRREGYQYNWARIGATSTTMIEMGQHTGAAEQVAAGDVRFVFIGVGANDFSPYYGDFYERIYSVSMDDEELDAKLRCRGVLHHRRRTDRLLASR